MINELIKIASKTKDEYIKKIALLYIGQMNTAGNDLIKKEVQYFIDKNKSYLAFK